ncbi:MAG: glycoside hydrolase family 2 TIM barrel-domain containing protein, partial [Bacteroidota bacterium]|nr:glycoside hydrolase family 2 TIM barrel-domain containing protein [Bacteroidota bacterium]
MKLRYLIGLNTFLMLLIFTLYFAMAPSPLDLVKISGNRIIVNNNPYFIKGVCYHPVSKGDTKRSFDFIDKDLALMREAGINTIRLYEPVDDIVVLDKIEAAGMRLIIGFGYNQNGIFDIASGSYIDYVKKYKSHKAILIWELGNEYNYHPEWFDGDVKNWYAALNSATNLIHVEDPNHPVSTAHGEVPSTQALALNPNLDLWGLNVYRWDKPQSALKKWKQ